MAMEAPAARNGLYAVHFRYSGSADGPVTLVGSFNHWDPTTHPLLRRDGEWRITVYLPPGTYPYAFVVGSTLTRDPDPRRMLHGSLGDRYSVIAVPDGQPPARAA